MLSPVKTVHASLLLAFCLLITVRADWWDDFSNNLATDLSPLLALFGEQVTKQFLSESTSILDNIIFAMAPLGIVTAVVSVIRVCGGPSLRAFIGRAQEGGGIAEAELCSSTSRDVCELYHNGAIVRVFGRPKILEVIHDRAANDFYYRWEQGQLKRPRHGIYVPREYLEGNSTNNMVWEERTTRQGPRRSFLRKKNLKVTEPNDIEARKQGTVNFAPNPNLSLNIGIKKQPHYVHLLAVGLGILSQASVVIFGGLATYFWQWEKDGAPPPVWAFPMMAVGTITLSCGMFFCAFLIERSTEERVFLKGCKDRNCAEGTGSIAKACQSTIYIIQPGNQSVGDQTYDSFAFSDASKPLTEYTTSWKQNNSSQPGEQLQVWLATGLTILGFAFQFVGLRSMHSSVSVVLLATILIMSIVRAVLRTGRLKKEQNLLRNRPDEVEGHELDWLALEMTHGAVRKDDRTFGFLVSGPLLQDGLEINVSSNCERDGTSPLGGNSCSESEDVVEEKENGRALICAFKDSRTDERIHEQDREKNLRLSEARWLEAKHALGSSQRPEPCTAEKIFYYRSRLAELTSQSTINKSKGPTDWGDRLVPLRRQAQQLKTAIESSTQILLAHSGSKPGWREAKSLAFSFNIVVPSSVNSAGPQQVHIFLRRPDTNSGNPSATWEVDRNSLEALLSLWNWSIVSDHKLEKEDEAGLKTSLASEVTKARVIATGATETELKSTQAELENWSDDLSLFTTTHTWTMRPGSNSIGAGTIWKKADGNKTLEPQFGHCDSTKHLIRLFGWPGTRPSNGMFALTVAVELSIPILCAQEVYQAFVGALATTLDSIYGNTTTRPDASTRIYLHNDIISRLADSVVSSGLGSHQDAYSILMPVLSRRSKLPLPTTVLQELYNVAKEKRLVGRFKEAETYLTWARQISLQGHTQLSQDSRLSAATTELAELYRYAWRASLMEKDIEKRREARVVGRRGNSWLEDMKSPPDTQSCPDELKEIVGRYAKLGEEWETQEVEAQGIKPYTTAPLLLQALVESDREGALRYSLVVEDLSPQDEQLRTVLSWAAERGWLEIVTQSLEDGSQVDSKDKSKRTPLSYAAGNGHDGVVRVLMQHGALPHAIDSKGRTPLSHASQGGHTKVMELLLKNIEATANTGDDDGWTPLHWAAACGKQSSIKLLTTKKFGTNIDIPDKYHQSPLIVAMVYYQQEAAKQLLEGGATWDFEIEGRKAWEWAFLNGHWSCGKFLLNLVNRESNDGECSAVTILRMPSEPVLSTQHMAFGQVLFDPKHLLGGPVAMCEMTDQGTQSLVTASTSLKVLGMPCRSEIWVYKFGQRRMRDKYRLGTYEGCSTRDKHECMLFHLEAGEKITEQMCLEVVGTLPTPELPDRKLRNILQLLLERGGDDFVVSHEMVMAAVKNYALRDSTLPMLLNRDWEKIPLTTGILEELMRASHPHCLKTIQKYLENQAEGWDVEDEFLIADLIYNGRYRTGLKLLLNYRKRKVHLGTLLGGMRSILKPHALKHFETDDSLLDLFSRHEKGETFKIKELDS